MEHPGPRLEGLWQKFLLSARECFTVNFWTGFVLEVAWRSFVVISATAQRRFQVKYITTVRHIQKAHTCIHTVLLGCSTVEDTGAYEQYHFDVSFFWRVRGPQGAGVQACREARIQTLRPRTLFPAGGEHQPDEQWRKFGNISVTHLGHAFWAHEFAWLSAMGAASDTCSTGSALSVTYISLLVLVSALWPRSQRGTSPLFVTQMMPDTCWRHWCYEQYRVVEKMLSKSCHHGGVQSSSGSAS